MLSFNPVHRLVEKRADFATVERLLSDKMTAYVEKQLRAAIRDMGSQNDGPAIEFELAGIDRKICRVLDADKATPSFA